MVADWAWSERLIGYDQMAVYSQTSTRLLHYDPTHQWLDGHHRSRSKPGSSAIILYEIVKGRATMVESLKRKIKVEDPQDT
jgi:hypothetical protein